MSKRYIFFLATLCIFQPGFSQASFGSPSLDSALALTTEFFQRLKANYVSQPPSVELYQSIDREVDAYVRNVKKSVNSSRGRRQLDHDGSIGILDGFENVPGLDIPDALDVSFFVHNDGVEPRWYAAALGPRGITLLSYQNRIFVPVGSYVLPHGTRVISHSCEFATLLVVQRSVGDVIVLRLFLKTPIGTFQMAPTLDTPGATHTTLWRGMNNIYLAVASPRNLTVFDWPGAHFDPFQTENLGARRLVAFQAGGSMYLAAIGEPRTFLLKFLLSSREFVVVQKLAGAADGAAFHLDRGHVGENFLALTGERATVVYRKTRHRFVPFQELPTAREIRSLANHRAAALLILIGQGGLVVYQYDGWRFVEAAARESGVVDARAVLMGGEELLALKVAGRFGNFGGTNSRVPGADVGGSGSGIWSFRRIRWRRRKSLKSLRDETRIWCRDAMQKTLRAPPVVPELQREVRIQRGHIRNLRVQSFNGQSAEKFAAIAGRWKKIVSTTKEQEEAVKSYFSTVNPVFGNLRAGNVRVNCATRCHAARTETAMTNRTFERLRRLDDADRDLHFRKVKASFAENLRCPIPAPKFRHATATGRVNGIYFREIARDVLRVNGDQELNASYTFANLHVANAKIPLDVASNSTRQDISAKTVEAEELHVNAGGLLLPLNGGTSVFSGLLTVSKARIKGLVDLRARITGLGGDLLRPMIHITEPLTIARNVTLRSVKIVETLEARDLVSPTGKSLREIFTDALPLNSNHVPVHFKFHHDKVSWTNMTLRPFPYKWVTKKHNDNVVITGTKHTTQPTVTFGKLAFGNLPTPRLPLRLCSVNVTSEGVWESNLVIDRGAAKSVKSINVFENSELGEFCLNAATSFEEVSWDVKKFTGRVTVNSAKIGSITDMDYQGLQNSMGRWVEPGRLKGSLKVHNLRAERLLPERGFKSVLPAEVGNVVSEQNIYVDRLNGYDFNRFLENVVRIENAVSLTNVIFAGGIDARDISAERTSFSLQENLASGDLGSKEILGTLESEAMIVPYVLEFNPKHVPVNIIANGNVKFVKEPKITNVNRKNLERLYNEVWLTDRATIASAESMVFEDVSFESDPTILKSFDTPNLGPWAGLENRLLSKTRAQVIKTSASFDSVQAPNVIGAAKSRLRSNVADLRDLEENSLKKNGTQVVTTNWDFDELIVTGNFEVRKLINGLNLTTDVVRYDASRNVITGKKKIFGDLTARNIEGLEFAKLARNALRKNNGNRTIVVKGWKSFRTLEVQDIRVEGKVMGRRPEESLLKSSTQNLRGTKSFRGSFAASAVETNGTVNEVRLKTLVKYQLKKRAARQIITSPILLANNLTILGNVTIDGLYDGVELRNFNSAASNFRSVVEETSRVMQFAEGIDVALSSRAVYWDKLELLEENSTPLKPDPDRVELLPLDGLGRCRVISSSLYCNDKKIFDALSVAPNGSRVLSAEVLALSGVPLVASVMSDPLGGASIFRYVPEEKIFRLVADLRIPGIVEGSVTTMANSLWMSLRLRGHTMILRYELWANFQQWTLPGGGPFLMSSAPTEELLVFRSDGVWRLGGLGGPRHVFRATLEGQIDTFSFGSDYYVQLSDRNVTTLLKTRYVGN